MKSDTLLVLVLAVIAIILGLTAHMASRDQDAKIADLQKQIGILRFQKALDERPPDGLDIKMKVKD